MAIITCDLSDDEKYILVWFKYDEKLIEKAKGIPRGKLVQDRELGRHWRYRADMDTAAMIKYVFNGHDMKYSERMLAWGQSHRKEIRKLQSLSQGEDAVLENLPNVLPELNAFINGEDVTDLAGRHRISPSPEGRPYQRADIKFQATCANPGNFNQPGTGKTEETIGSVYEEGIDEGPKLVICPRLAVNNTWVPRLEAWTGEYILGTTGGSRDRDAVLAEALEMYEAEQPFWLAINWAMIRTRKSGLKDEHDKDIYVLTHPILSQITWNVVVADEWHREGLANTNSVTRDGLDKLTVIKKHALSGTPVRGNLLKLWGCLNWLEPKEFSSKWAFADQWLEVEEIPTQQVDKKGEPVKYKKVHGIREDREEAFYEMLSRYMCRRTKEEVLPWLPKKQYPDPIWVEMTPKQKKQYQEFALNAEVRIEEERLSATSILAEYARLKQFANAFCQIAGYDKNDNPIVVPTEDSPKLEAVEEILGTLGIGDKASKDEDPTPAEDGEQVVIFSQSSKMVDMVEGYLAKKGIKTAKITGAVKDEDRDRIMREFQAGGKIEVVVMTTTAGGVSVEFDRADNVIFLDETWVPDDQEQAEDRLHRGSRAHQVVVWYIRTKDTIEQYIEEVNVDKADINRRILDLHRAGFRALQ